MSSAAMPGRVRPGRAPLFLALLAVVLGAGGSADASGSPARTVTSIRTVGPLFVGSTALPHLCTASVVRSARHDLVLTAAHCLTGNGAGLLFAPGYHDGVSPYGVWPVRRVYVDAAWASSRDPRHDVAVLQLAPRGGRQVEDVTGSHRLGDAPPTGTAVTVDGYVAGTGGRPITCTRPVGRTGPYPTFGCAGYEDGVSGGPWLAGGRVVGVTGGLHQGGCTPDVSYSSPFGRAVAALLARAARGGPGDVVAPPGPDGCG